MLTPGGITTKDDWETPPAFFAELDAEFGFTLDACATAATAKCGAFFTPADDALLRSWDGVVWMNPPYGRQISAWVEKAFTEAVRGATVVCLLPARTSTAWWHDYCMRGEVRFIRGRLKFVGAPSAAPFPSAVVIFRPGAGA
jgi:phage N-6-adenine-methyltransferase